MNATVPDGRQCQQVSEGRDGIPTHAKTLMIGVSFDISISNEV
jgi:thiamine phosphate synthase YjbQ (UPF0047 family)